VISAPYGSYNYVDEISVYIDGSCDKGKHTISPLNNASGLLERNQQAEDMHCPYITIKEGDPDVNIRLPGTSGSPLKFKLSL